MRYRQIAGRPAMTESHPVIAEVALDPAAFDNFERAVKNRPDVLLLARIDQADRCIVDVGCSRSMVRRTIQGNWG